MKIGLSLIDRASKMCGSDSKLAEVIGVHRVAIAEMRNGKRRVTPETAAEMAWAAGEDAREVALQVMIENAEGTRREGVLREILGKGLALGVMGLLVFSYSGESISKSISATSTDKPLTTYTSWNISKLARKAVQSLLRMARTTKSKVANRAKTQSGLSLKRAL